MHEVLVEWVHAKFGANPDENKESELANILNRAGMDAATRNELVPEVLCGHITSETTKELPQFCLSVPLLRWAVAHHTMLDLRNGQQVDVQSANVALRVFDVLQTPEKKQWFAATLADPTKYARLLNKCWGLVSK